MKKQPPEVHQMRFEKPMDDEVARGVGRRLRTIADEMEALASDRAKISKVYDHFIAVGHVVIPVLLVVYTIYVKK